MNSTPLPTHSICRRLAALATAAIVLLAAACGGGSDGDPGADDTVADTAVDSTVPAATDAPQATEAPVESVPATDAPVATEAALAEFDVLPPGPYDVGVQTITITDPVRARPLTVDVWFPIADSTGLPPQQYSLLPGVFYESPTAVATTPDLMAPDGPYPLVVYSHGSGGLRYLHSSYTEAIASYGYIVAAPDHTGNTALERLGDSEDEFDVIALNRPQDVEAVIDAMTNPESTETAGFVASVDPERIAVTGHSFGGFTAYAMASGYTNALGSFTADPQVDAIIALAPATGDGSGRLLTDENLAAITIPALAIVGTNDQTTPANPNVDRPWELSNSSPSYRADLVDAQHQTFTDMCDYQETVPLLPDVPAIVLDTIDTFAEQGCAPGDMPIDRAKDLTNTFAISFLESVFRGGTMIDPTATVIPDDVIFAVK
jgi:predicted dienelactone hydrolase